MRTKEIDEGVRNSIFTWSLLTTREADILVARHTMGMTQEMLAKKYKISRERVRQIEDFAIEKIKHALNKKVNE